MTNPFTTMEGADLVAPGARLSAVTASDTIDLPLGVCKALLVGTAGAADFVDADGQLQSAVPLQLGYNPIGVMRIHATNLTAGNIWAVYDRQSGSLSTTTQIVEEGERNLTMHLTGRSDGGAQEISAVKVNLLALARSQTNGHPQRVNIVEIQYDVPSGFVELAWDADSPVPFAELRGFGKFDYRREGGLVPVYSQNATGNILLTTGGFSGGSTYNITLRMIKKYSWNAKAAA